MLQQNKLPQVANETKPDVEMAQGQAVIINSEAEALGAYNAEGKPEEADNRPQSSDNASATHTNVDTIRAANQVQ